MDINFYDQTRGVEKVTYKKICSKKLKKLITNIISRLKMKKLVRKGLLSYLYHVQQLGEDEHRSEDVLVVNE